MQIDVLPRQRLAEAAALVAACQSDPATHVAYLSTDPATVAAELAGLEPDGPAGVWAATGRDGALLAILAAEHDRDPPRVWWHGPFVAGAARAEAVADRLYAHARMRLPGHVREEELAGDERGWWIAAFAERHGFTADEASAVLSRSLAELPSQPPGPAAAVVRPPTEPERAAAALLHDQLFPGTHATGRDALRDRPDRLVLVALAQGAVVGYLAAEVQHDGAGYLDFLGVAEAARGRGVGTRLVLAGCRSLRERWSCQRVHLTVRVSNGAARGVYARLGFVEERVLRPWRRGFSLP